MGREPEKASQNAKRDNNSQNPQTPGSGTHNRPPIDEEFNDHGPDVEGRSGYTLGWVKTSTDDNSPAPGSSLEGVIKTLVV